MSAVRATRRGVPLSFEAGELVVEARPSDVPSDQLAALRAHKAALLPILAAFGTAMVEIRPATPIPDEPKLGDWVWCQSLRPRPRKAASGAALWRAGGGR